ncbi:hypothetical protein B5M09_013344, partial [Aphanomyces astaci]
DDHDSGSPVAANDDSGRLGLSTANTVSPGDAPSDVMSQATLPARVGDAGSSENVNQRSLPRTRGSAASATTVASPPSTDPWTAFAAKRVEATKASRAKDVGTYRPSMADLEPLLAKHAAGTLSFHDTLPIQKHDKREVVGWLHMATGNHTKAINEDAAMASLLHDNQSLVKGDTLVDVIKCEKDPQNHMLRWGIASETALRQLQGAMLKLRITTTSGKVKSTTFMTFQLTLPHALDGFFMDIPAGLHGLLEERLLFETLHRLEPRFLWGMYTSVSTTTGMAGSRYRLHFLGSEIPSTMLLDGRMVEEFIVRGRHRPTMDELAPLLEKHAAGQLTFNDLLPIQKHSTRDVVGWLHMVTGAITKDIDVDTAMASLLFGNRDAGLDTALADIVQCEKDVPNRTIKWGIASEAALNKLRGVTMYIQVARNGAKQGFPMTSPHVLDGFFLDIPQGLQGVTEERLLFDVMARLEPRFLWGTYTSVSASSVLANRRPRDVLMLAMSATCKIGERCQDSLQ